MKTALLKLLQSQTRDVLHDVIEHLDACGVFLPDFHHVIHRRIAGSYFRDTASGCFLHLGCYPTRFVAEWFVMHEVGHVLWHFYEPCRRPTFKRYFGADVPDNYVDLHRSLSFYGPIATFVGLRPGGEPSPYGAQAGGEERFCELLGLMYATGGFDRRPPNDLKALWSACWNHGLARMTHANIRNT